MKRLLALIVFASALAAGLWGPLAPLMAAVKVIPSAPGGGTQVGVSNTWTSLQTFTGGIAAPDGGANSEAFGSGADNATYTNSLSMGKSSANTGGNNSTAVGYNAGTFGVSSTAVGANTRGTGDSAVVLGENARANRAEQIMIGRNATGSATGIGGICVGYACAYNATNVGEAIGASVIANGANSTLIGDATKNDFDWCVAIRAGRITESSCTASNQFVAGNPNGPMSNVYFGKGVEHTTPTAYTISGTRHASANSAGAELGLTGGEGRGTGTGGPLVFYHAPAGGAGSTLNTKVERMRIADFIQLAAVTFANLGTPSNGSIAYCSDCTIANPCAGSGTGALAKRLNSAWICN